jgi:hypothetical protein
MITDIFDEGARGVFGVHQSPSVASDAIPSAIPLHRMISAPAEFNSSVSSSCHSSPLSVEKAPPLGSPSLVLPALSPNITSFSGKHLQPSMSSPVAKHAVASPAGQAATIAAFISSTVTPRLNSPSNRSKKSTVHSRNPSFRVGGGVEVALERSVQVLDGTLPVFTHKIALLFKDYLAQPEHEALKLDTASHKFYQFSLAMGKLCPVSELPFQAGLDVDEPFLDGEFALVAADAACLTVFHAPVIMNPKGYNIALQQMRCLEKTYRSGCDVSGLSPENSSHSMGNVEPGTSQERILFGECLADDTAQQPASLGPLTIDVARNVLGYVEYHDKLLNRKRFIGNDHVHIVFCNSLSRPDGESGVTSYYSSARTPMVHEVDWFVQNICQVVIVVYATVEVMVAPSASFSGAELTFEVIVRPSAPASVNCIAGKYVSDLFSDASLILLSFYCREGTALRIVPRRYWI